MAVGIAASQPTGVREQFGSMTKALHPGAAARVGLMAALLARHGYTASSRALEAPRGLLQTYSTQWKWDAITAGLGKDFEIAYNTYRSASFAGAGHRASRVARPSAGAGVDRKEDAA